MIYRIEVESKAAKQIEGLQVTIQIRILEKLEALATNPRPPGCKRLRGQKQPAWRVRAGDYRILYRIHDDMNLVRVYGVLRRDEAYR